MLLTTLLEQYKVEQSALKIIAETTITNYCCRQRMYLRFVGERAAVADFTRESVYRFCVDLASRHPASVRMSINALRHFVKWLVRQGWLQSDPTFEAPIPPLIKARREPIEDNVIVELMLACERLPENERRQKLAKALIAVLNFTGLRRNEVLHLRVEDIHLKERYINSWNGKGGKHRRIFPAKECLDALEEWLSVRPCICDKAGACHCLSSRLFVNRGIPLECHGLYSLLKKVKIVAGYKDANFTPHRFRHSIATRLSQQHVPLETIRSFLNHASIATTGLYVHSSEEDLKAIAHLGSLRAQEAPTAPTALPDPPVPAPTDTMRSRRFNVKRLRPSR